MTRKSRSRLWRLGSAVVLALLVVPTVAQARPPVPERRNLWAFYLWLPGIDGSGAVRDIGFDADASVSDVLETFQDNGDGAFAAHYERIMSSWTLIADLNYWKLRFDAPTRLGEIAVEPASWIVELAGAKTISYKELKAPGLRATAQVVGGVRYTRLEVEAGNETIGIGADGDKDWVDPFIGLRYLHDLNKNWSAGIRFDIGGFGVGSDFTWNLLVDAIWHFSKRRSLHFGWHVLDQDYEKDDFRWDIQQSGPFLALSSRF